MKKFLLTVILFSAFTWMYAQSYCNKQAPKISYTGKAPWDIDGQTTDWQTILGPLNPTPTGSGLINPYQPPPASSFNWVIDKNIFGEDPDAPAPDDDLNFMAQIHDDYNVYFYLRRSALSNDPNSFYYFIDLNGDAVMSNANP